MASDMTVRCANGVRGAVSADTAALLFVSVAWIAAIVLVNPLGEFPVVDDWAYLASVRAIVERGELVFSDFAAQNLLSHLVWGSLFALPFGASYTTLRFATLVAALLAAFALYRVVRNAGGGVSLALFAAVALLFNPIFFPLSFGFMTDVPFVAAQTGAMLFLLAGLSSGSRASSAAGWFLAIMAQLSRQTGFAIPVAYAGAYLVRYGVSWRRLVIALLPLVAFIGLQWGFEYWLAASGKMSEAYGKTMNTVIPRLSSPAVLAEKLWDVCRYAFFYLGLFLLPLSIPLLASALQRLKRSWAAVVLLAIAAASAMLIAWSLHIRLVMPVWPHTWKKTGVGAENHDVAAPEIVLEVVTALSIVGGVLLLVLLAYGVYRLVTRNMTGPQAVGFAFGLLAAAAFAGSIGLVNPVFDRYLLPLIPCVALALVCAVPTQWAPSRWSLGLSFAFLLVMAAYSVASVHNYTAEKRTYRQAIADLMEQGVPRDTIDAGWVWNGEHGFGRYRSESHYYKGWYRSRDYVVTVRQRERDYVLLRRYPVPRWQMWGRPGWSVNVYGRPAEH